MHQHTKVGILGAGHVGLPWSAYSPAAQGICDQIVLLDIDGQKASSQAEDIADAIPSLLHPVQVTAGGYGDITDADVVVLAACGSAVEQDRLQELEATWAVAEAIAPQFVACGFCGIVVSISNPCDIIAQRFAQRTGRQVIGTGTALDSARLRRRLAQWLGVAPHSVCAYMLGEHGDSQVAALHPASVAGIPLFLWLEQHGLPRQALAPLLEQTVYAGWHVLQGKGCTEFGIGGAAAALIRAILRDEAVLPCAPCCRGNTASRASMPAPPAASAPRGSSWSSPSAPLQEDRPWTRAAPFCANTWAKAAAWRTAPQPKERLRLPGSVFF